MSDHAIAKTQKVIPAGLCALAGLALGLVVIWNTSTHRQHDDAEALQNALENAGVRSAVQRELITDVINTRKECSEIQDRLPCEAVKAEINLL